MSIQWLPELRRFRKHLASNLLIIVLLGVGLASTQVIFNFTKALVLDPLPFANAGTVQRIGLVGNNEGGMDEIDGELMASWAQALRPGAGESTSADAAAFFAVGRGTINVSGAAINGARPERYDGGFVYGAMWSGLGIKPALGRDFNAQDFLPGAPKVAVIGDKLWRSRFNADPGILGKSVRLNGTAAIIVAVMAPNMTFPMREQVWTQAQLTESSPGFATFLRRDANFERHVALLQQLFEAHALKNSDISRTQKVGHSSLKDWVVNRQMRTMAGVMFGAVMLLLVAVCLNAASVLLVRLLAEQTQNSVRLALGSGWRPLALSALVQSVLLSLCGAWLASYLARAGGEYVLGMFDGSEEGFPGWIDVRHAAGRLHLYGFALLCALLTAALPIMRLRTLALSSALRSNSRSVTAAQSGARWLVLVQVSVSCAVVLIASVVFQRVQIIMAHPVGVNASKVVSGRIGLFPESYPDAASLANFRTRLTEKLAQNSGVKSASLATAQPGNLSDYREVGAVGANADAAEAIYMGYIDQHFLSTYQIPLRAGRALSTLEMAQGTSNCSVLIDERLAALLFVKSSALGQQLQMQPSSPTGTRCTIVGIIAPVELNDLDGDLRPAVFAPLSAMPLIAGVEPRFLTVAALTHGAPSAFKSELAAIVSSIDADLPVYWLRTGGEVITATTAGQRVLTTLFGGLSAIALALSAAGLYGLLAFQAAQRTREVGVRLALGARKWHILRAVFGQSLSWVAIGCAVGVAIAVLPARLIGSVMSDAPINYGGLSWVFAVFALTTLIAAIKPALNALAVTPQTVLKQD
jgi:putative ABC transport system permease protein